MDLLRSLTSTVSAFQDISKKFNRRTMSSPEVFWPAPMRAIGAQNLLTMPGGVSIAGYLHKKGGSQFSLLKWPLRYIIIHKGCVYYFKSSTAPAPQGAFSLNGYNRVMRAAEETTSNNVFPFKIVHFSKRHRTWFFSAASEDERRKWMRHLRREIDHYNDRKESHLPSDSDSDGDSFYGTIERLMDIKHPVDTTNDDYVEEDDDEDEEDYIKPDNDCSPTSTAGRPTGPPPSYPPPPVPSKGPNRQDPSLVFPKGSPLPILPIHRLPLPQKPLPSIPTPRFQEDPVKGPTAVPFMPCGYKLPSFTPPPPPPPNSKKPLQSRLTAVGVGKDGKSVPTLSVQSPATLPICDQLASRLTVNGPSHCLLTPGGSQSLGNNLHRGKLSLPAPRNTTLSVNQTSPSQPRLSPPMKTRQHNKTAIAMPPPPGVKPPIPASRSKPQGSAFQRASPEGQSFRSLSDETPVSLQRRQELSSCDGEDIYEDMLLPESVFIDSNETSFVEKLFRESMCPPQDGMYGIRNSMTKTTKVLVVWDISIEKARNYRLFEENGCVFLESDVTFPALSALIKHYHGHPLPHHGSLCLQKPFTKCDNSGVLKKKKPN